MTKFHLGGITFGKDAVIKSVQNGSVFLDGTNATTTITAVDTTNSVLLWTGQKADTGGNYQIEDIFAKIELTNGTTITGSRIGGASDVVVEFQLIEFVPGVVKSNQTGSVLMESATTDTKTINSVNTNKCMFAFQGYTVEQKQDITGQEDNAFCTLQLTDSTTVTGERYAGAGGIPAVGNFQVVEFY